MHPCSFCRGRTNSLPSPAAQFADAPCLGAVIFTAAQLRLNFLLFPELCSPRFSCAVWGSLSPAPWNCCWKDWPLRIGERTGKTFHQRKATSDVSLVLVLSDSFILFFQLPAANCISSSNYQTRCLGGTWTWVFMPGNGTAQALSGYCSCFLLILALGLVWYCKKPCRFYFFLSWVTC